MKTRGPRSFIGGRGFDYLVRFETELNSDGKLVLQTEFLSTKRSCTEVDKLEHIPVAGEQIQAGFLSCGQDRYQLVLDIYDIVKKPSNCW